MWFGIGLLTLGVTAWLMFRWRLANRWKGQRASLDGRSYEFNVSSNKGRVVLLKIGIDCATGMHFCLKRENAFDRLFKSLGLSEEQQLNRLHFDERIYVLSDDKRLGYLLRLRSELHAPLADFFDEGARAGFRVHKLWCRDRRLWIEAKPAVSMKTKDCNPADLAGQVLPVMQELAELLASSASPGSGSQDHFFLKACLLTAVSAGLAVNGVVQLVRLAVVKFPVTVDNDSLLLLAGVVGVGLLFLLVLACVALLGRTSRMHLVLLELLLVGGFGSVTSAYAELRDYNTEFDTSVVRTVPMPVNRHYFVRCGNKNRSTCYHVELGPSGPIERALDLKISKAAWSRLAVGQSADVPLHDGALGLRWIEEPRTTLAAVAR